MKTHYAKDGDDSPLLSNEETKYVQAVAGCWDTIVLCKSSQYNHTHGTQLDRN
jgi:hypothetical protein